MDAHHPVDEQATAMVGSGRVELAGRVATRRRAFGAVLTPRQERAGHDPGAELGEAAHDVRGQRVDGLEGIVHFGLVHRGLRRRRQGSALRSGTVTSPADLNGPPIRTPPACAAAARRPAAGAAAQATSALHEPHRHAHRDRAPVEQAHENANPAVRVRRMLDDRQEPGEGPVGDLHFLPALEVGRARRQPSDPACRLRNATISGSSGVGVPLVPTSCFTPGVHATSCDCLARSTRANR